MKYLFKTYAMQNGRKLMIYDREHELDRLDELESLMKKRYTDITERSGHKVVPRHMKEAAIHAYALWVACDKMQVINPVGDTRYVMEVTLIE